MPDFLVILLFAIPGGLILWAGAIAIVLMVTDHLIYFVRFIMREWREYQWRRHQK